MLPWMLILFLTEDIIFFYNNCLLVPKKKWNFSIYIKIKNVESFRMSLNVAGAFLMVIAHDISKIACRVILWCLRTPNSMRTSYTLRDFLLPNVDKKTLFSIGIL